jgi:hypothetical protein
MEVPVATFPTDLAVAWDFGRSKEYGVTVHRARNGRPQRQKNFDVTEGYRTWSFSTKLLSAEARRTFENFLDTVQGPYLSFFFFDPFPKNISQMFVGTIGTAPSCTLEIPARETTVQLESSYHDVIVNGSSKSFSVSIGSGSNGEDELTITGLTGGDIGAPVYYSFNGKEKHICTFLEDNMLEGFKQNAADLLSSWKVTIIEVER